MSTLQQILSEHRIPFAEGGTHRHVREGWLGLDCPWCGSQGKHHLGVHLGSLRTTCWRCGYHSLAEVLGRVLRMPASEAWKLVRDLPRSPRIASEPLHRRGGLKVPSSLEPLSDGHRGWLKRRGLDPELLEGLWGLRGLGLAGRLSWRIWAPVHLDGEVVSWTTRTIGTKQRRWIHAGPDEELLPIKSLLYGWDYVRSSVVIVEGASDVWRVGPGAVATFGVLATVRQVQRLASVPRRVICFDREPEAQRAARKLAEQLRAFPGETLIAEIESADPGEATDEEVAELRSYLE